ncbi:MAG TPA: RNA pseudouridine synthase [Rhodospirillaceae bacterium]|nr:RNA pseudouridine synthase [Rhodospirillaceae bacterium]
MTTVPTAAELQARVLYRDSNLIILDKPAGLAVHGGPRTDQHLEGLLEALCFGLARPPRLAHRIDRDTAGCLVLARHDKALARMGRLFAAGRVTKTYWAVVAGRPPGLAGRIDLPLQKVSNRQGWRMVGGAGGKAAATEWRLRGLGDGIAWLELSPLSGRTHQVRVHCAAGLGCPILGDPVYGSGAAGPLQLLARAVSIPYWADRPPVAAVAGVPPPMQEVLDRMT